MANQTVNNATPYTEAQTKTWLSWLARGMETHGQTVFMLEQLQPSWLTSRSQRWAYVLSSRAIGGLAVGLIVSLNLALGHISFHGSGTTGSGLFALSVFGMCGGVAGGLAVGIIDGLRYTLTVPLRTRTTLSRVRNVVLNIIILGFAGGLVWWLVTNQVGNLDYIDRDSVFMLLAGFSAAIIFGLIFGVRSSRRDFESDIQPVESVTWSWRNVQAGVLKSLALGSTAGVMIGIMFFALFWTDDGLNDTLFLSAIFAFCVASVSLFMFSLRPTVLHGKSEPNQGIALSIRTAFSATITIGMVVGGAMAIVTLYYIATSYGWHIWSFDFFVTALIIFSYGALFFGSCAGLWYGGLDVIQHYTLRLILYLTGRTPLSYERFLDYSAEHLIFLQKVGGSYIFIHRMLLEHFAAMGEEGKSNVHETPALDGQLPFKSIARK